jgi:methyl-accepting chemotaxis protein
MNAERSGKCLTTIENIRDFLWHVTECKTDIAVNKQNNTDNTQNIADNKQNIADNTQNIADNEQNIADHTQEIHNINTRHLPPNIRSK